MRSYVFRGKPLELEGKSKCLGCWVYGGITYKRTFFDEASNAPNRIILSRSEAKKPILVNPYMYDPDTLSGGCCTEGESWDKNRIETRVGQSLPICPGSLGCYLNRFDKNGTPIWEGDIVTQEISSNEECCMPSSVYWVGVARLLPSLGAVIAYIKQANHPFPDIKKWKPEIFGGLGSERQLLNVGGYRPIKSYRATVLGNICDMPGAMRSVWSEAEIALLRKC